MHIEDDYSWAEQTILKNNADGLLASAYIPEFEDVADGERLPATFPAGVSEPPCRLLWTMLQAVRPWKETGLSPIPAVAEN